MSFETFDFHYVQNSLSGICPGDKIPSPGDPLVCVCPVGSIQSLENKCLMCSIGEEVPNEEQTAFVGML